MTPAPNEQQDYPWEDIPPFRRHLYVYLLLVLGAMVANSLLGTIESRGRLALAPVPPPRITSQEVYPAPVPAPSPSPSEAQ